MQIPNQVDMQILTSSINKLIENHQDEFQNILKVVSTKFVVNNDFVEKLEKMNYWDVNRPTDDIAVINDIRFKVR